MARRRRILVMVTKKPIPNMSITRSFFRVLRFIFHSWAIGRPSTTKSRKMLMMALLHVSITTASTNHVE